MKAKTLTAERVQKLADDIRDVGERANEDRGSYYPYMTGALGALLSILVADLAGEGAEVTVKAALEDAKAKRRVSLEAA